MGRRQDRALSENPDSANIPKGIKGDTTTKMIPYTDGLLFLPESGGLLDQPFRLMSFFDSFEAGEQEAFNLKLK